MESLTAVYEFKRELPNKKTYRFSVQVRRIETEEGPERRARVSKADFEHGYPTIPLDHFELAEEICKATQTEALEIISDAENAAVVIRPFDCQ